jgi:hypothetical protein
LDCASAVVIDPTSAAASCCSKRAICAFSISAVGWLAFAEDFGRLELEAARLLLLHDIVKSREVD